MQYRQSRAIVTGGLGFLGSNLVLALLDQGARVTVIDSLVKGCGGSVNNLGPALKDVELIRRDLGDADSYSSSLRRADVVFNLAGEISHIRSMRDPLRDFRLNAEAQLKFLVTLARVNRGVRVVYAGTRQIYGRPRQLPVAEDHPIEAVDFNGIHKFAAWQYHAVLSGQNQLDAIGLLLTNVYGPRLALHVAGQGVLGVFLRLALEGRSITVFGDGGQTRDPIFVDDAVDAFLRAGCYTPRQSRIFNLGGGKPVSLLAMAQTFAQQAGRGSTVCLAPFPSEHAQLEIGSYVADWSRLNREMGWSPLHSFEEGVAKTVAYFQDVRADASPWRIAPIALPAESG